MFQDVPFKQSIDNTKNMYWKIYPPASGNQTWFAEKSCTDYIPIEPPSQIYIYTYSLYIPIITPILTSSTTILVGKKQL